MKRVGLVASLAVGLALTTSPSEAQERPDFSGVWRLDPTESSLGPLGEREITWIIDHRDPKIHVVVDVRDPEGSKEFSFRCMTDGRECVNELFELNDVRRIRAVWEDAVLVMTQTAETPHGDFEASDRLYTSESGERLVFERIIRDEGGEREITEVFRKLGPHPSQRPAVPDPLPSIDLPSDLDRVLRDYERHWRAGNADGLAALFTDDGFVTSRGGWIRGRDAIREAYQDTSSPLRLRAVEYAVEDDVGYIIGAYGYGAELPGPDQGMFILTLNRAEGDRWLISADLDGSMSR